MAVWRSIIILRNAPCAAWPWEGKIGYSPDQRLEVTGPLPSIPSSRAPSSTVSNRRPISPMSWPRSLATGPRSEEHTSELQSLMRISYAVFCLKKKKNHTQIDHDKVNHPQSHTDNTRHL